MANKLKMQKILFLDEKDYQTFIDFSFLISNLASFYTDTDIDELQASLEQFVERIDVEMEEDY